MHPESGNTKESSARSNLMEMVDNGFLNPLAIARKVPLPAMVKAALVRDRSRICRPQASNIIELINVGMELQHIIVKTVLMRVHCFQMSFKQGTYPWTLKLLKSTNHS
jgi:hypothetical protein